MSELTPGDVFAAATEAFVSGDAQGWLALAHPDIVLEFPFAPAGLPARVEGKDAVARYLHAAPGQIEFDEVRVLHTHQSTDPATAVIEWSASGHIKATGAPYEMAYAVVVTLVDGLIARYREYWNPLVAQQLAEAS